MKPINLPIIPSPSSAHQLRALRRELHRLYHDVGCPLDFQTPIQLLVATILSAQCTDVLVNKITPALFARFPDAQSFARAERSEVEQFIKTVGFFRNKAKNIIRCCQQIVEQHSGEVPKTMEELVLLAGVGRKTANVLLNNAYGGSGIAVDTHVARLALRLGLTRSRNPVVIERELYRLIPKKEWSSFGLHLVYHGRRVCRSRKPRCEQCSLAKWCPKVGVGKAKNASGQPRSEETLLAPLCPASGERGRGRGVRGARGKPPPHPQPLSPVLGGEGRKSAALTPPAPGDTPVRRTRRAASCPPAPSAP